MIDNDNHDERDGHHPYGRIENMFGILREGTLGGAV
jgi:hypothetical protein